MISRRLLSLLIVLPAIQTYADIQWGNHSEIDMLQSNGTSLLDETFHFQIGTFKQNGADWVPLVSEIDMWDDYWIPFQTTTMGEPLYQYFSETLIMVNSSSSPYQTGDKIYLWAYNFRPSDTVAGSGIEWALMTAPTWIVPGYSTEGHGGELQIAVLNGIPIFGATSNGSTTERGGGTYTSAPTGEFQLQTHTLLPVPEPSVTLLSGGLILMLGRRRRNG